MSGRFTVGPDDREWRWVSAGPGLGMVVPHEGLWRQRPSLHFEASSEDGVRLMSQGQPLFWMRIHFRWSCCGVLRGPARPPFSWALPPIQAAQARGMPHEAGSWDWWESWTWHFARELEAATATVLHSGRWSLHPLKVVSEERAHSNSPPTIGPGYPPAPPHALETALRFDPFWVERWNWSSSWADVWPEAKLGAVLALREPSRPDASRVKAWRKHARDGTLPPALLLYMELPGKWLVLDGHDRIHASLLEGTTPPLLGLWPVITHLTEMERLNPGLGMGPRAITRAWPIQKSDWQASVLRSHPRRPDGVTAEDWDGFVGDKLWARGD